MLYSVEFLRASRDRLAPGGVHCQWLHLYETDRPTVSVALQLVGALHRLRGVEILTVADDPRIVLADHRRRCGRRLGQRRVDLRGAGRRDREHGQEDREGEGP